LVGGADIFRVLNVNWLWKIFEIGLQAESVAEFDYQDIDDWRREGVVEEIA